MARLVLLVLLLQQWNLQLCRADFSFTLSIFTHSTSGNCFGDDISGACETFFSLFCLRGGRTSSSTSRTDCPLGRDTEDFFDASGSRTITSVQPWTGDFQLFIQAFDDDAGISNPDFLDNIFINSNIEAGTGPSAAIFYTGTSDRVTVFIFFEVNCLDDFYGDDCNQFCQPQSSNSNGYYTCDQDDGSLICLDDYYGSDCRTFCSSNEFYTCDQDDGSLICRDNYYRSDCTTFCSSNEFYTCDQDDGSIICREGFTEEFCTTNIDDCAESPCRHEGTCVDLVSGYQCDCLPGYEGTDCEVDIQECLQANCPVNSTCVESVPDQFECVCHSGFEGENCTEIQPCASTPCQNGGTCVSEDPFSFDCLCPPGFNGSLCEVDIDECFSVLCENGGLCVSEQPLSFGCVCLEGYTGASCELDIDECLEAVCEDGMLCINEIPGFMCVVPIAEEDESKQAQSPALIIGSAVGSSVVVIIALILHFHYHFLAHKEKDESLQKSQSHTYHSHPGGGEKAGSALEETMDSNPLYNGPFPLLPTYGVPFSSHKLNTEISSLVTSENSGCGPAAGGGADTVIYDQIGTNVKRAALASNDEDGVFLSANVAYGTLGKEAIDNPLYGKSATREPSTSNTIYSAPSTSSVPLTYSVPRATHMPVLKEIDGYTILSDARETASTSSSCLTLSPPPPKVDKYSHEVQYESIELKEVPHAALENSAVPTPTLGDTSPGHYAVPTAAGSSTATAATTATAAIPAPTSGNGYHYVMPRSMVGGEQRYSKLQHDSQGTTAEQPAQRWLRST